MKEVGMLGLLFLFRMLLLLVGKYAINGWVLGSSCVG